MEDVSELHPREVNAAKHNLNYIGMDGNIGCLGEWGSSTRGEGRKGLRRHDWRVGRCEGGGRG